MTPEQHQIRVVLDNAWRLAQKANRAKNEFVARAFFAASDAMVKTVADQGFDINVTRGGFTWTPKKTAPVEVAA